MRRPAHPDSSVSGTDQLQLPFGPGPTPSRPAPDPRPEPVKARSRRDRRPPAPPRQVRLPDTAFDEPAQLAESLGLYLPPGKTLDLTLTDNRYSMISVSRAREGYRVRAHRMFASAPPRVLRALARYVVHNDRRASMLIGQFIEEHQHTIRKEPHRPRRVVLRPRGRFFDLGLVYERLNAAWFGGSIAADITWGPDTSRRARRRSIKMGSYSVEDKLIRVHPALDAEHVPEFFVAWIVFHEMLHAKHGVVRQDGRRRFHTPAFVEDERRYPDYERAIAWEKANLDRLLARR